MLPTLGLSFATMNRAWWRVSHNALFRNFQTHAVNESIIDLTTIIIVKSKDSKCDFVWVFLEIPVIHCIMVIRLTCPIQWMPHCLPYSWLQNHIKRSLMPISTEDGRILNYWMEWFTTSQCAIAFTRTDMGWQKLIYLIWFWWVQNMLSPSSKSTNLRLWKWKLKIVIALQHYMPIKVAYNSAKSYVLHRGYTLLL